MFSHDVAQMYVCIADIKAFVSHNFKMLYKLMDDITRGIIMSYGFTFTLETVACSATINMFEKKIKSRHIHTKAKKHFNLRCLRAVFFKKVSHNFTKSFSSGILVMVWTHFAAVSSDNPRGRHSAYM